MAVSPTNMSFLLWTWIGAFFMSARNASIKVILTIQT